MKISAKFNFEKVIFDQDTNLHLVVNLTAPKKEIVSEEIRRPILILPVLDISGSMQGDKLNYAKESIIKLIDHLGSDDYCGLVTFESEAKLVSEILTMSPDNKTTLKNKVKSIRDAGSTAFAAGMLMALHQVNRMNVPENTLIRVIMFTDGQANVGIKGKGIITLLQDSLKLSSKSISLSSFGYGLDADQELLADLANKGNGNYAFIKNANDAPTAFARELGGLLSTYAENIKVKIVSLDNNELTKMLSDVTVISDNKIHNVILPEMLSEESINLVASFKVGKVIKPIKSELVKVVVTYTTVVNGIKSEFNLETEASLEFVNKGEESKFAIKEVDSVVALAQLAQAQMQAEDYAKSGDYKNAVHVMNLCSDNFGIRGYDGISKTAEKMSGKMRSRNEYVANSGYLRSTHVGATRGMKLGMADAEAGADLESLNVVTSNSFKEKMVTSFSNEPVESGQIIIPDASVVVVETTEEQK